MNGNSEGRSSPMVLTTRQAPAARFPATLDLTAMARLFGTTCETIPADCQALIGQADFRYRTLSAAEQEEVLQDVVKRINSRELSTAGPEGKPRWEHGWLENLVRFRKQRDDLSTLVPKYLRTNQPLRLNQQFIVAEHPNFEYAWFDLFRRWLFRTYCHDAQAVFEFGCGSGFNLAALASLYPEKRFVGLDWAAPSTDIVNELGKTYGWNMQGRLFDFFEPDERLELGEGSIVLTIGALEQTGQRYEAFLQYLLKAAPRLCVHIEPIVEWYDKEHAIDASAIGFHQRRRYWEGFPDRLKELERAGRIEILKLKRSYFGSLYIEGYSQVIWRPR